MPIADVATGPKTGVEGMPDMLVKEAARAAATRSSRCARGANYGWPVVSYGFQCDGGPFRMGIPMQEGMEAPVKVYVPSIAPSDLVIYRGQASFPARQGGFLLGAMAGTHLNRGGRAGRSMR